MKIPETTANVGAYYGNEENGQWQPNGVIIDSGVGGGVVGSGDAGVHRPPPYPLHIPRSHIPGYVMAGAYYPAAYPAAPAQDDFADYMWMEHEEEFDKQDDFEEYMWMADEEQFDKEVMQQLEEEALMEQCIEAMLEDEQRERTRPSNGHGNSFPTTSSAGAVSLEEAVSRSTLNPLAAEFVPTRRQAPSEETPPTPAEPPTADPPSTAEGTDEDAVQAAPPPEVSAAEVCARADRSKRHRDRRGKTHIASSDTKLQPKKKDTKAVKSESKVSESAPSEEPAPAPVVTEAPSKPQPPSPSEETGPKPINYAAAAKANKPKKPPTPPTTEKTPPPTEKPKTKTDKPIQRKNSTK